MALPGEAETFVAALSAQVASTSLLSDVVLNGGNEADRVVDAAIATVDDEELQQLLKQLGSLVLEVCKDQNPVQHTCVFFIICLISKEYLPFPSQLCMRLARRNAFRSFCKLLPPSGSATLLLRVERLALD